MKRWHLIVVLAVICTIVGCTITFDEPGWDVPKQEATGVVPALGTFYGDAAIIRVTSVDGSLYAWFSRNGGYSWHSGIVENGRFYIEWGEIGGTHCPTDAFCISGHFTTPTTAEGCYRRGSSCQPGIDLVEWQATLQ